MGVGESAQAVVEPDEALILVADQTVGVGIAVGQVVPLPQFAQRDRQDVHIHIVHARRRDVLFEIDVTIQPEDAAVFPQLRHVEADVGRHDAVDLRFARVDGEPRGRVVVARAQLERQGETEAGDRIGEVDAGTVAAVVAGVAPVAFVLQAEGGALAAGDVVDVIRHLIELPGVHKVLEYLEAAQLEAIAARVAAQLHPGAGAVERRVRARHRHRAGHHKAEALPGDDPAERFAGKGSEFQRADARVAQESRQRLRVGVDRIEQRAERIEEPRDDFTHVAKVIPEKGSQRPGNADRQGDQRANGEDRRHDEERNGNGDLYDGLEDHADDAEHAQRAERNLHEHAEERAEHADDEAEELQVAAQRGQLTGHGFEHLADHLHALLGQHLDRGPQFLHTLEDVEQVGEHLDRVAQETEVEDRSQPRQHVDRGLRVTHQRIRGEAELARREVLEAAQNLIADADDGVPLIFEPLGRAAGIIEHAKQELHRRAELRGQAVEQPGLVEQVENVEVEGGIVERGGDVGEIERANGLDHRLTLIPRRHRHLQDRQRLVVERFQRPVDRLVLFMDVLERLFQAEHDPIAGGGRHQTGARARQTRRQRARRGVPAVGRQLEAAARHHFRDAEVEQQIVEIRVRQVVHVQRRRALFRGDEQRGFAVPAGIQGVEQAASRRHVGRQEHLIDVEIGLREGDAERLGDPPPLGDRRRAAQVEAVVDVGQRQPPAEELRLQRAAQHDDLPPCLPPNGGD